MIPGGPLYGLYIGMAYMEQKLTNFNKKNNQIWRNFAQNCRYLNFLNICNTLFSPETYFFWLKKNCRNADTQKVGCRYQNDQKSKLTKKIFNLNIFFELFGSFRGAFYIKPGSLGQKITLMTNPSSELSSDAVFDLIWAIYFFHKSKCVFGPM